MITLQKPIIYICSVYCHTDRIFYLFIYLFEKGTLHINQHQTM